MPSRQRTSTFALPLTAIAAACLLCACGSSSGPAATTTAGAVSGVVASSGFVAGSATDPTIKAGYYSGALVCVDSNNNGHCDASENPVTTDANGKFTINALGSALIADIGTNATNTATGAAPAGRVVLRASADQVTAQATSGVVISPMSSEVQRLVEANATSYATESQNLAARLGLSAAVAMADANTQSGTTQATMLTEMNALGNRFAYATVKFDRGDKYPDALAVPGGDPTLPTTVSAKTHTVTSDTRQPITFLQAQQAAFNVEGIPRYDNIFIIMLENRAQSAILGSQYAPNINAYLKAGNQLTSYFATGNPSEPNYTALGGADDWGITDDNQWNCNTSGATLPTDSPMPSTAAPSPFTIPAASCTANAAPHNVVGRPNLFNAMTAAGLTWRTYSESMNPGQDFRVDAVKDPNVFAQDHVYGASSPVGAIGNPDLLLPMPAQLYRTKHHPGMAYQNVRSAPEFAYSNRTMGGGQWDNALATYASDYTPTATTNPYNYPYNIDQLGSDLQSGKVGNLNFLMPDQCDDMHGITVSGTVAGSTTAGTASDCSGNPLIYRGDLFVKNLVTKIQSSPLWTNPQKKVAIVLMYDEGSSTYSGASAPNSCCGWVPGTAGTLISNINPVTSTAAGVASVDSSLSATYGYGNHGHGNSVFGILTNQTAAPKGVTDSDDYSHFSFVRTLQDMFQLADPTLPGTYMNRSKYTESFIAQNILNLPEYTASADTHLDSVRPINHAFVIPAGYTVPVSADVTTPHTGPDASQTNVWATH